MSEEYDLPSNRRFDDENAAPPTTFSRAPQITIPLPQVKTEPEDSSVGDIDPPEELLNAVEALIINPIRMQATRQLPFLRRNLRQGFIARCADVLIPIHPNQKRISLAVTYEHVDNIVFRAEIEDWLCPLCGLFGKFTTQATLCCHLKWDHQEIFSNWEKSEETDVCAVDVFLSVFSTLCLGSREVETTGYDPPRGSRWWTNSVITCRRHFKSNQNTDLRAALLKNTKMNRKKRKRKKKQKYLLRVFLALSLPSRFLHLLFDNS